MYTNRLLMPWTPRINSFFIEKKKCAQSKHACLKTCTDLKHQKETVYTYILTLKQSNSTSSTSELTALCCTLFCSLFHSSTIMLFSPSRRIKNVHPSVVKIWYIYDFLLSPPFIAIPLLNKFKSFFQSLTP